jgi:hypothetical protein
LTKKTLNNQIFTHYYGGDGKTSQSTAFKNGMQNKQLIGNLTSGVQTGYLPNINKQQSAETVGSHTNIKETYSLG